MKQKMATVNTLKCKHPENEVKMHFAYLWQCSAHSNSTSKDLVILLLQVHHQNMYLVIHSCHVFGPFQLLEANIREKFNFSSLIEANDTQYKLQKIKVK